MECSRATRGAIRGTHLGGAESRIFVVVDDDHDLFKPLRACAKLILGIAGKFKPFRAYSELIRNLANRRGPGHAGHGILVNAKVDGQLAMASSWT